MRADGKSEGLRQSMSWLHTWSGLVLGWLLFVVFFTGTLSYYLDEINIWMQPELHRSVPGPQSAQLAIDQLQRLAPKATSWSVFLPHERQITTSILWTDSGQAAVPRQGRGGARGGGSKRIELDAATGEKLDPRTTAGGRFLYRFHFELHAMPRGWSRWIVGIATMVMFVAIISGVITHKKIFTDFFTFRPRKGQRSWLDAHNATAVLALPFHVMITFSGLLLLMLTIMPWAIQTTYGDTQRYIAETRGGGKGSPKKDGQVGGARSPAIAAAAPMAPVGPMIAEARRRWVGQSVGQITVNLPGTPDATVELREQGGINLIERDASRRLVFDGTTGALKETAAPTSGPSFVVATVNALTMPHLGRFAGPAPRWLLFLGGVAGTLMIATGMVLWVVKRLPERRKRGRTPIGHRIVEVLNVGAIVGLPIATAVYFWANRLLPADLEGRANLEIRSFFVAWLLCALHPLLRNNRQAWIEQLLAGTLLYGLLPVLNPLTGGAGLNHSLAHGQWTIAAFDLSMLSLAALLGVAAWQLLHPRSQPAISNRVAADGTATQRGQALAKERT